MYIATFMFYVALIGVVLQTESYYTTNEALRQGLGAPVIGEEFLIKTHSDFWNYVEEHVINTFLVDVDSFGNPLPEEDKYFYQEYLHVYRGILLVQWLREKPELDCLKNFNFSKNRCAGAPAYSSVVLLDPFDAAIQRALDVIQSKPDIDVTSIRSEDFDEKKVAVQWLPHTNGSEAVIKRVHELNKNKWLNTDTSRAYIVMIFNNPSQHITTLMHMDVDFSLGGLTRTEANIQSFNTAPFFEPDENHLRIGDIAIGALALFTLIVLGMTEVVRRCIKYKKNKEEIERPKLIRLIIAITFSTLILLSMIILWIYVIIEIQPSLDALFTFSEEMRSDVTEIVDFMKIIKQYNNINSFYSAFRILNNINITLFLIRFIDLLQSYKAFKSITNTLTKAMWPLFAFLFYFAIILTGFALIAVVNFGADSGKFYNFEVSMETLSLFICCGIFDYQEVKRSSPTPAWFFLYFWVFVFLVVFVLLNFFLGMYYN
eukprot:TRINITY_DN1947_c0_g1_i1.p1 TRINITY_DN1947_c0_g1~~TRINITY_DN1947_c0_g1_i1.p1  ORF type:complete len:547 (+),score=100.21 TRINITY_DN1947_c0_g1_i1:183-1643(+)